MHGVQTRNRILVTCAKGIPPFLREEIRQLGLPVLLERVAGVETEGTIEDAMSLNLHLRTGQRVLFLLHTFPARTADELYAQLSGIAWEDIVAEDGYMCITSSVSTPAIRDHRFANLKCKDAIVDRIRRARGKRPDSGSDVTRTVLSLYWHDSLGKIYLDTSGEPLSRRGYRKIPMKAPMQETLAAAVILATGWKGCGNVINPMCGSGTLAIEAALIGLNRAPGLLRSNFGFMHIRSFRPDVWNRLREKTQRAAPGTVRGRIIATDWDPKAVDAARKNAQAAGVERLIEFGVCAYAATPVPSGGGIVILNPEYGERMGHADELEAVYRGIGDFFKQRCSGYTGYVFTGNLDLAKKLGLRTKRKVLFFNGEIECRLLGYELYEGTVRQSKLAAQADAAPPPTEPTS